MSRMSSERAATTSAERVASSWLNIKMFCLPWLVALGAAFACTILTSGNVTDDDIDCECNSVLVVTTNTALDIRLDSYGGDVILEKLNTLESVRARMPQASLEVDPQDLNRGMLLDIEASRLVLRTAHEAAQGQYMMNITGNVSALEIDSFAYDVYVFSETFTAYVVEIDDPAWLVQLNIGAPTKLVARDERFRTATIVLGVMLALCVLAICGLAMQVRKGRLRMWVSPTKLLSDSAMQI